MFHALLNVVDLLSGTVEVGGEVLVRLEWDQIVSQLWELLVIDGNEKVEHEERRPDAKVSQSHRVAGNERISTGKKPFHALVAASNASDFISGNRAFSTVANRILQSEQLDIRDLIEELKSYANLKESSEQVTRFKEQSLIDRRPLQKIFRIQLIVFSELLHKINSYRVAVPHFHIAINKRWDRSGWIDLQIFRGQIFLAVQINESKKNCVINFKLTSA